MEPEKKYETSSIDDIKALFESRTDDNIIPLDELDDTFKPKPAATPVKASSPQYPKRKTSAQKKRNRLIANIMIYSGIALLIIMCAILVTLIFTGNNGDSIKGLEITNSGDITLRIGHSEKLKVKTEPSDTEYALSYVSADTSVATVSLDGKSQVYRTENRNYGKQRRAFRQYYRYCKEGYNRKTRCISCGSVA